MKKILYVLISYLAVSMTAQAADISLAIGGVRPAAEKVALLVGGGCDGDLGNFVTEFNAWGEFLEARGWQVRGWVEPTKHTRLSNVQPLEWRGVLTELENLSREAPSQVLVVLVSHGNYKDRKHGVCAEREIYRPVADLAGPLEALQEAGVQTAVIDMSGYSSYSVEELQRHAMCVVSMAGKQPGSRLAAFAGLQEPPSAEAIWFAVLDVPHPHLPLISGAESFSYVHHGNWGSEKEKMTPFNKESAQRFFEEEKAMFTDVFSAPTLQGISDYLKGGGFKPDSVGVLGVRYLQAEPQRELRACANFYF